MTLILVPRSILPNSSTLSSQSTRLILAPPSSSTRRLTLPSDPSCLLNVFTGKLSITTPSRCVGPSAWISAGVRKKESSEGKSSSTASMGAMNSCPRFPTFTSTLPRRSLLYPWSSRTILPGSSLDASTAEPVASPMIILRTLPCFWLSLSKVLLGNTCITRPVRLTSLRPGVRSRILSFASMRSPAPFMPRLLETRCAAAASVSKPAALALSFSISSLTAASVRLGFKANIFLIISCVDINFRIVSCQRE